ncbi:endoribonuclease YbeY isoform X3 [Mirounga angustirostris]|uniref:endoribonuclease YbeY isoform X4 n=1 Tax=Mirounga leonina TaxID=9715 RepID=UPI00156C44CE|nr:endoribonuclease YbeY isoform X4 [Mirounga leonina]XP_054360025.1 endoribonuclease YbeY isoform X4 [Mirounga angustirostris]
MSLVLRNLQRAVPIRRAPLRKKMEIVRSILGVQKFDLGIICVDNKNIQHINRIYREKNIPTDVLSFPFHENIKAGELPQPDFQDDYNLGDIFLGVEYIFQQCKGDEDYYDILTRCHYLQWRASPPGLGPSPPRPQLHVGTFSAPGDCHPWALSPAGLHTQHRGGVAGGRSCPPGLQHRGCSAPCARCPGTRAA